MSVTHDCKSFTRWAKNGGRFELPAKLQVERMVVEQLSPPKCLCVRTYVQCTQRCNTMPSHKLFYGHKKTNRSPWKVHGNYLPPACPDETHPFLVWTEFWDGPYQIIWQRHAIMNMLWLRACVSQSQTTQKHKECLLSKLWDSHVWDFHCFCLNP
jgi:hypothetical protein